ncbi:calmodulin-binding transcription activator 2-like isoform X1 [Mytilus galloprovincialis]|uniref:calmodulin-binding transcription activator 2-like isoform X1 n=2 Tax=Mytilus galloprovincialis TaxID=29158 RepID=UPI003F7BCABD
MKMDYPSPCNHHVRVPSCDFPKLPKQLDEIPSANEFPLFRHRWNSNEEVAAVLTAFDKHKEWMSLEVKIRPPSGSMILYSRKKVRYKKDGYCWKKRKGGKNIREDHMKLKVQGLECIYGSYVHSDILPTFHRRCYWLLQNPDIVLIHYLNVPYPDDGKVKIPMMPGSVEKKEWTKEELVEQLRPMFSAGSSDQMLEETVEKLVKHLIQYHESQDKNKGQNIGYKKISCHSKPEDGASSTGDPSSASIPDDSQCKDILMNTVCQLNAKTQQSFPQAPHQRHSGVLHIQPKATDSIPCSENLTQAPFLLSVSQLPTTSYLLLSGGVASNTVSSVTVTSGCQQQPIPHVLDQSIHHMSHPIQVPHNIPGQLNLFAHPNSTDHDPHKTQMVYSEAQNFMPTSCTQTKTDTGHVPHLRNVSADDIQDLIHSSFPVETSNNYANFPQAMNDNNNTGLPLTTSDYNILDNLDFEISEIEKLYNDLSRQPDTNSLKGDGMHKNNTCDQELTNEINLFNSDLVQSCQVQPEQNFPDISTICDNKTVNNGKGLSGHKGEEHKILDYSPEWSNSQGGEKVLVVGPWCSLSSHYLCLFDSKPVPTTLIQPGVLRCFSPAHNGGVASLQVSCDGHVISNSVPFKYVSHDDKNKQKNNWFSISVDELKLLLLDRLFVIQEKLKKTMSRQPIQKLKEELKADHFEKKVVLYVKSLISKPWGNMTIFPKQGKRNMTLLHIAAALGYQALVHTLIVWRTDNPSWVLDCQVDSHALDDMSCTPLVWACAKGYISTVQFLYHWNPDSIHIMTKDQLSPFAVAEKFGHSSVVNELTSLTGKSSSLSSPSKQKDSSKAFNTPADKMEDNSVFKSPNSVLGSLHIDIPGQYVQSMKSNRPKHSVQSSRRKLAKHFSIDCTPEDFSYTPPSQYERPVRETNSEPRLCSVSSALTSTKNPMLYNPGRDLTSPDILIKPDEDHKTAMDHTETPSVHVTGTTCVEMDTDLDDNMSDVSFSSQGSPLIDVERLSSDDEGRVTRIRTDRLSISGDSSEDAKRQMVNLAQQIIAAMPMRIKLSPSRVDDTAEFAARERSSSYSSIPSQPSPHASSYEEDSGISTPMGDGFAFDEYRYSDLGTPASSLNSPESTCIPSPYSPYDFKLDSPPPTTEEFTEYFNAPATFMEKDFSLLTLSDQEQRKLYEAAKCIQKTYRKFRNKQQMTQQQKEMEAAVLIQKYYRRYKQYAYYKKMTQAAVLIQSQFRSYYAQKRFKKSRDAAVVIQNQYRTYKEHERLKKGGNKSVIIQQRYRSHYQRIPKHVGRNSDGQIVQIVPEGPDSTQADQSNSPDNILQLTDDSITAPSSDEKSRESSNN